MYVYGFAQELRFEGKMSYKFIGYPVSYTGKTIWEIIGNLKNFGVGRLIVADEYRNKYTEPTFYRIIKAQPLDTPKQIGIHRKVIVHAESVFRGKKLTELERLDDVSDLTKYHLVPKEEEVKYLSGITDKHVNRIIPKYQTWPPLFKLLEEQRLRETKGPDFTLPPLNTIADLGEKSFCELSTEDSTEPTAQTDLYITDKSVEEMFKEIVSLQIKLGIEDRVEEE